jgi:hypothetical protein
MELAQYREKHGIYRSYTGCVLPPDPGVFLRVFLRDFRRSTRKPLIVLGFPRWESENFSSKRYAVYMIVCILFPSKYLSKVTLYRTPNETNSTRTLAPIAIYSNSRVLLQIEFAFRRRRERHYRQHRDFYHGCDKITLLRRLHIICTWQRGFGISICAH